MEGNDFINKYRYYDWTDIPNGMQAAIAKYRQFKQVEYNNNPMIEALPPIFSQEQFIDLVAKYPIYDPAERELEAHDRFHCIERLSLDAFSLHSLINHSKGLRATKTQVRCVLAYHGILTLYQKQLIYSKLFVFC